MFVPAQTHDVVFVAVRSPDLPAQLHCLVHETQEQNTELWMFIVQTTFAQLKDPSMSVVSGAQCDKLGLGTGTGSAAIDILGSF